MTNIEIEKKFLVLALPDTIHLDKYQSEKIIQGYLAYSNTKAIRLRNKGGILILSYKSNTTVHELQRTELECELTQEQFDTLWPGTTDQRLEKIRYRIPLGKLIIELDIFKGINAGHMFAEVEFDSTQAADSFIPPTWFGMDISTDERYDNGYIAKYGFPV